MNTVYMYQEAELKQAFEVIATLARKKVNLNVYGCVSKDANNNLCQTPYCLAGHSVELGLFPSLGLQWLFNGGLCSKLKDYPGSLISPLSRDYGTVVATDPAIARIRISSKYPTLLKFDPWLFGVEDSICSGYDKEQNWTDAKAKALYRLARTAGFDEKQAEAATRCMEWPQEPSSSGPRGVDMAGKPWFSDQSI